MECEVLLKVTSDALRNAESTALTHEQQQDWVQMATRSLQSAVRKLEEAEHAGEPAGRLTTLRARLEEQVSRLGSRFGVVVDREGRVVRRPP